MNASREKIPDSAGALVGALRQQRQYTLALYADLPASLWTPAEVPYLKIINPPLWELAHIAWFAEYFGLRHPLYRATGSLPPSRLEGGDQLFDSGKVAHASRWHLDYPSRDTCLGYMARILDELAEAAGSADKSSLYDFQLALLHEDMHGEALAMTLKTLALPLPAVIELPGKMRGGKNDLQFPGGNIALGAATGRTFLFDNEKPEHAVTVNAFSIAAEPVSAAEFARFAGSPAYRDRSNWTEPGWQWQQQSAPRPEFADEQAVAMHINAFEAEAYCRWTGRRLPTEAEWEFAAVHSTEFAASTGEVWEWTASAFAPFPGFEADVYGDYSEPWFHSHRVLKGGSFVTHPRLKYPQYRNFYMPERRDMFCGFRTCALN